jgi:quercetin dioxygenase-like cupin family protein
VIENFEGKKPMVLKKGVGEMVNVPELAKQPCEGCAYGLLHNSVGTNLHFYRWTIAPKGKVPKHDGSSNYFCYIEKGSGVVGNVDENGVTVSKINFKPGDLMVFRPFTMHYWENGEEKTECMCVEQPTPGY